MPVCQGCGGNFQWALVDDRWVLLEPIATHNDLDRKYVDEDGILRADHRDRHDDPALRSVVASRLAKRVHPDEVAEEEPKHRRFADAAKKAIGRG